MCAVVIRSFAPVLPGAAKTPDGTRYAAPAATAPAAARNSRLLSCFDRFIVLSPFCAFLDTPWTVLVEQSPAKRLLPLPR
jgi:hypothetical protein